MNDQELSALKKRLFEQNVEDPRANALELVDHLMYWFSDKAKKHKRKYKRYRNGAQLLVAIVSILSILAIVFPDEFYLSWGAAVLSVLAATFTTLLTVTNAQKDWLNSRTASQKFQIEKFLFLQQSAQYDLSDESQRLKLFSQNLTKIWNTFHANWEEIKGET